MNSTMFFSRVLALFLFAALIVPIQGCAQHKRFRKNAENAFANRAWDDAVANAVNSLYQRPEKNEKAQEILDLAYPRFVTDYKEKIQRLSESSSNYKDSNTILERQMIVRLYETLIRYTSDVKNLPPAAFQMESKTIRFEYEDFNEGLRLAKENLAEGKENAAETHYQSGIKLMAEGGIRNGRSAAREFKKAQEYVANYKDAASQYEKARVQGTVRVAILPFENMSGQTQYGAVGAMITDRIVASLFNDKGAMEFLEIVDREQLSLVMREQKLAVSGAVDDQSLIEVGKILGVQEIITGRVTQIVSDPERITNDTQPVKNTIQVQVGTKKNAEGKDVPVYENREVSAMVTSYSKTAGARISGSYKIIDIETAKIIDTNTFTESYSFRHEWGSFRGDERALNAQQARFVRVPEQSPLSDGERVSEVTNKLANSLATTIKKFTMQY